MVAAYPKRVRVLSDRKPAIGSDTASQRRGDHLGNTQEDGTDAQCNVVNQVGELRDGVNESDRRGHAQAERDLLCDRYAVNRGSFVMKHVGSWKCRIPARRQFVQIQSLCRFKLQPQKRF